MFLILLSPVHQGSVGQLQARSLQLTGTNQPSFHQRGDDRSEARVVFLGMAEDLDLAHQPDTAPFLDIHAHRLIDGGCTGRETRQQ